MMQTYDLGKLLIIGLWCLFINWIILKKCIF